MRFAAYSGLRAGEIAGLNVGDLDLLTPVPTFTPGGEPAGQFCTRPDVELHVYVPQVVLHRVLCQNAPAGLVARVNAVMRLAGIR